MKKYLVKALSHQNQLIKCSLNDHFAFRTPVSVVFFYRTYISEELIIDALQKVLQDFPIFAGVLRKLDGHLLIDCNNQGISLKVLHSIGLLFHNRFDLEHIHRYIDPIFPSKTLNNHSPVLNIVLNYYTDGLAIGYSWHHSIGDMATFMEFLKALSLAAQHKSYEKPFIPKDRENYLQTWNQIDKLTPESKTNSNLKRLSILDICSLIKARFSFKKTVYFHFTEDELAGLKSLIPETISRSTALCAYLLTQLNNCHNNRSARCYASLIVNIRKRINMPLTALGNFLDLIWIHFEKNEKFEDVARVFHKNIGNYSKKTFNPSETQQFVKKNGGIKNIGIMIPEKILPKYKNLVISNWANFSVYSIDFGVAPPYLVAPLGKSPLPWISWIVEGFHNRGLLVALNLPSRIAKRLTTQDELKNNMLESILRSVIVRR